MIACKQLSDQEIFEVARKIDSREARENYLLHVCDGDQEQQTRVLALLQAYEEASSFLESPASGVVLDPTVDQPADSRAGEQIGPYKLLQEIGEGGMGTVWMAEQQEPVRRRVAIKLIKPAWTAARCWPASRPNAKHCR